MEHLGADGGHPDNDLKGRAMGVGSCVSVSMSVECEILFRTLVFILKITQYKL